MTSTEEKAYTETSRDKVSQENMEKMYHMFMEYENSIHQQNLRRIKIGIRCIWIIPAIFMFLMFFTGSSKTIFLTLWICSLFAIAVYLIWIEYIDYNLQVKMNEIHGNEDGEISSLIEVPDIVEERVLQAVERIDDRDLINLDVDRKLEEKKEEISDRIEEHRELRQERQEERQERREERKEEMQERISAIQGKREEIKEEVELKKAQLTEKLNQEVETKKDDLSEKIMEQLKKLEGEDDDEKHN